jgi:hypothetical protein
LRWPTIAARDGDPNGRGPDAPGSARQKRKKDRGSVMANGMPSDDLSSAASLWATATSHPRTHDPRDVDHGEQLANQVHSWIGWTPDAPTWPTPDGQVFQDGMDCTLEEWEARRRKLKAEAATPNGNGAGTPLAMAAQLWTTPQANDAKDTGSPGTASHDNHTDRASLLAAQVKTFPSSPPAPATATPGNASSGAPPGSPPPSRPRLSPIFVFWLMGWPLTGLGSCGSAEMESCPFRPRMRSAGSGSALWMTNHDEWFRVMRAELLKLVG